MRVCHKRLEWWLRHSDGVTLLLLHLRHGDSSGGLLLTRVGRNTFPAAMTGADGTLKNTSNGQNMRTDQ